MSAELEDKIILLFAGLSIGFVFGWFVHLKNQPKCIVTEQAVLGGLVGFSTDAVKAQVTITVPMIRKDGKWVNGN